MVRLRACDSYNIAKIVDNDIPDIPENDIKMIEFSNFSEFEESFDLASFCYKGSFPYKSPAYLKNRYFEHPSYDYHIVGAKSPQKSKTAVIFRVQECNGSRVVRIVDIIGDVKGFSSFTNFFDRYMEEITAEYADVYEFGIEDDFLESCGWKKVDDSGNIIPNYFGPFLQKNVDIFFCTSDNRVTLFKGDGDQDRPN